MAIENPADVARECSTMRNRGGRPSVRTCSGAPEIIPDRYSRDGGAR